MMLAKNGEVKFTDITKQSGFPQELGMVTSALWTDFDNDGWQDLMVAGEFMPITFIKNEKGKSFLLHSPLSIHKDGGTVLLPVILIMTAI